MRELQLVRSTEDKRRLDLAGVGTVRFENMWGDGRRVVHGDRRVEVTTPASRVWSEKPVDVTVLDEDFVQREPLLFLLALYAANRIASSRQAAAAVSPIS
jgi:hypothetical protein